MSLYDLSKVETKPSEGRKITIIGGAAVDIIAQSDSITVDSGSSHVGTIRIHEGGSARNVAECLARLGLH